MTRTSMTNPLMIDAAASPGGGLIGVTICPGKKITERFNTSWERDLDTDMAVVQAWRPQAVVTLMEQHELERFQVAPLGQQVRDRGIAWHHLPIRDVDVPGAAFEAAWSYSGLRLRAILAGGGRVLVHCRGGLGRTGTIAARLLIELGTAPEAAIRAVRAARPSTIETAAQEACVRDVRPISPAADAWAGRVLGCLLGGAVGDGFGYAVEFDRLAAIHRRHGPQGLRAPVFEAGRLVVSDDTQMTLFTLEGMLRAVGAGGAWQEDAVVAQVRRACLDWLDTQSGGLAGKTLVGALAHRPALRVRRAPGTTCLAALQQGGHGSLAAPANDSKGCGAAMRSAPLGLLAGIAPAAAARLGARTGALTHGHADGWGAAAVVAAAICRAAQGATLAAALAGAITDLDPLGPAPTRLPYRRALDLAERQPDAPAAAIATLGEGWVGEEAVAIAAYAALTGTDFAEVMALAANHDGDSDSTAAIAGQLWGACHGIGGMPHEWIERLDVRDEVFALARALIALPHPAGAAPGVS